MNKYGYLFKVRSQVLIQYHQSYKKRKMKGAKVVLARCFTLSRSFLAQGLLGFQSKRCQSTELGKGAKKGRNVKKPKQ